MNNRKIHAEIARYLTDNDKLIFRMSCKDILISLRGMPGVCYTQKQFLLTVSGIYKNKSAFNDAWSYYQKVIKTANQFPATLHKLRDPNVIKFQVEIMRRYKSPNYMLGEDGRLYFPGPKNGYHTWNLNYAWMKANIDLNRAFIVISEISDEYLKREHLNQVSAFASEIGMTMLADYTLEVTLEKEQFLIPPKKQKTGYFVLSQEQTISFFKQVQKTRNDFLLKHAIDKMHSSIKEYDGLLNIPVKKAKDFLESFNIEILNDFAELCIAELSLVLAKYPKLITNAAQLIPLSFDEKLEFLSGDITVKILLNGLVKYISNKFILKFESRLKEFDDISQDTDDADIDDLLSIGFANKTQISECEAVSESNTAEVLNVDAEAEEPTTGASIVLDSEIKSFKVRITKQ